MGWPGIYSIFFSQLEGDKDSSPFDGIFSAFIGIGFNKGYRMSSLFKINLFSLLVRFSWIRRIRCYWGLSYFPYQWDLV